jgi:hypothetical protein
MGGRLTKQNAAPLRPAGAPGPDPDLKLAGSSP